MFKMKLKYLVLVLLFGSILSVGLILISLTTNSWILSYPLNKHSNESSGELRFGLFYGSGIINIGYGSRPRNYSVYNDIIANDTNVFNYSLWILTTTSIGLTLICDSLSTIFTLLKTASKSSHKWTRVLIFINILSLISNILSFASWLLQFNFYLKNNILISKDQNDGWYSNGLSILGYGFYIVAFAILVTSTNLLILNCIRFKEHFRTTDQEGSTYEEKTNGDIMLY
ncbi:hypothetical protein ACFFRR_005759 [Megaselia abdita]